MAPASSEELFVEMKPKKTASPVKRNPAKQGQTLTSMNQEGPKTRERKSFKIFKVLQT
jgi:hypothetical protein